MENEVKETSSTTSYTKKAREFFIKYSNPLIIFMFAAILICGMISTQKYGISWDEPLERIGMYTNAKEYAKFLGIDKITNVIDGYNCGIGFVHESDDRDHGQAVFYPSIVLDFMTGSFFKSIMYQRFFTFGIFWLGLICLYSVVKRFTGSKAFGAAATLLMNLSPRFFAEGTYNSKDTVLLALVIITFNFAVLFIEKRKVSYGILTGITAAFAANMRILGFWLIFLIGVLYIINLIYTHKKTNEKLKIPILSGVFCVIFFFGMYWLITPASWYGFIDQLKYTLFYSMNFSRWDGAVLYMGKIWQNPSRPLPWHYLPVMFAITTPIFVVAACSLGIPVIIIDSIKNSFRKLLDRESKYYIMLLVFVLVPALIAIINHSTLYNSWRHFYFCYGPLIIVAFGALKIITDGRKFAGSLVAALISIQLVISTIWIIMNPGTQFCYYNFMAINKAENFEFDYWNVSITKCLTDYAKTLGENEKVSITGDSWSACYGLVEAYDVSLDEHTKPHYTIDRNFSNSVNDFDLFISNPTYTTLDSFSVKNNYDDMYKKLSEVKVGDVTIMAIYKSNNR
jgi:hypothetical protein